MKSHRQHRQESRELHTKDYGYALQLSSIDFLKITNIIWTRLLYSSLKARWISITSFYLKAVVYHLNIIYLFSSSKTNSVIAFLGEHSIICIFQPVCTLYDHSAQIKTYSLLQNTCYYETVNFTALCGLTHFFFHLTSQSKNISSTNVNIHWNIVQLLSLLV